MKPLNVTFRLGAVFCLLLAILLMLGWQSIGHLRGLDAQIQNVVYDRWTDQQLSHQAFQLSAQNSQITLKIFLLDDTNAIQPLLVQRASNTQRITDLVNVIEPRLDTDREIHLFAAVKAARMPYLESYQRALALLIEQKHAAAARMMVDDVCPKLLAYQNAWSAFDQSEADEINRVIQQSKSNFATSQWKFLDLLAIAGFMAAGIAAFVIRILKREMAIRQRAEKYLQQSRELEARLVERTLQLTRTNESLVETSALLETLLANTNDYIYFKDLSSRFVHFSQAMLKHLRLGRAGELTGRTDFDFFAEVHARPAFEVEQEIIRTGQPVLNLEEKEVHLNGQVTWALTCKMPWRDPAGTIIGTMGITRDITERKRSEEALRESEERFSNAFQYASIGVALVAPDGKWLKVNRAICDITGYAEAELLARTFQDITHPEDLGRDLESLRETLAGKIRSYQMEKRYVHAHGHIITVLLNVSLVRDAQGQPLYFISQIQDITERKRAEAALLESKLFLRSTLDALTAHIAILDEQGIIVEVNAAWNRYANENGFAGERCVGINYLKVCDAAANCSAEASVVAGGIRAVMAGQRDEFLIEYACPSPQKQNWFMLQVTRFGNDGPVRVVVAHENITEQKEAEAALRASEERFRGMFTSAATGIAISTPQGRFQQANAAYCNMLGYTEEELQARNFASLTHPDDLTLNLKWRDEMLAGQREHFTMENRYLKKNGDLVWTRHSVSAVRAAGGGIANFIMVAEDFTEWKRTERRFRRLMDSNVQGVFFWNTKGEITEANNAFLKLTRYTREDLMAGRINWVAMTPQEYVHLDRHALDELDATRVCASYEKEWIRKDGSRVPILIGAAMLEDGPDDGVCFVFDLTERKKLETQLIQSQKMETVGKLAGGIAHEFNSILTAIMGQSELLLHDLPMGSPLIQNASEISQAAARAATLTRQLLAYGRKQLLQPEALDLNRVITNLESVLKNLLGADIDLRIIPAPELFMVKADAGQIEQVILNLIINARDAMPNGGRLTLETANATLDQEYVSRFPEFEMKAGHYVMLAITDTGTGMSDKIKARLFEPFFTTKSVGQGTGLGLSTCYGIVKQSGGHISVYSELGRGTTFKIYLPKMGAPTKIPIRQLDSQNLLHGKETILLVEDDSALRAMAATLLQRLGYIVLTAGNGVEALNLLQERSAGPIDLLFTDFVMPHMSGKELAGRVRALYPQTSILFTSAYTENAIAHQGILDKDVAMLQKPFTPSALASKVRDVLGRKKLPAK
jgi:PAS domain S-box-containing protein